MANAICIALKAGREQLQGDYCSVLEMQVKRAKFEIPHTHRRQILRNAPRRKRGDALQYSVDC
jgi:hypothetical protein